MMSPDRRFERSIADTRATLAAALIDASGTVPDASVDWHAFHARLSVRAALPLARLRSPRSIDVDRVRRLPVIRPLPPATHAWWEHAARWSRITVSASLAASVVLVTLIRLTPKVNPDLVSTTVGASATDSTRGPRAAFESAVVGRAVAAVTDSVLMPSATELLVPLGVGGGSR